MASTGTTDVKWSAIVAWTVDTLISAERPETHWDVGGAGAMPGRRARIGPGQRMAEPST